jgi:hypothetical protein
MTFPFSEGKVLAFLWRQKGCSKRTSSMPLHVNIELPMMKG